MLHKKATDKPTHGNPEKSNNLSRYSIPLFIHPRPEVILSERHTADSYLLERLKDIGLK